MSTTLYGDAFLQAILQDPAEVMHRLVFADWLEERGDAESRARAEFIRAQCALADLPPDDERRPAYRQREHELRKAYGAAWARPVARLVQDYEFRRGFVERVRVNARRFLKNAPALFRQAPVRHLDLTAERATLSELAACPYLARVAALDLEAHGADAEDLAGLLDSPHLRGLRSLRLRCPAGAAVQALTTARPLPALEALDLGGVGVEGLRALLAAWPLPALTALHLADSGLGDAGMHLLAASPVLGRLTALDLAHNGISSAGAGALARSPHTVRLSCLWLGFNGVGDAGAEALAASPRLAALTRLYLSRNGVGSAGVQALAASPHLAGLTHLDLDYNEVPARGLRALAASAHLNRLQALYLRCGAGVTAPVRKLLARRFGERVCQF